MTHRKIGKVLTSVQDKMKEYLATEKGYSAAQLNAAFNDTSVKQVIQKHMLQENIQLMHDNQPVYRKAMTKIGREGAHALNESPNAGEETAQNVSVEPELTNLVSDFFCLTVASPVQHMNDAAFEDVQKQVNEFIRRHNTIN